MSLVGTRPILPDELEQYELHHRARIAIKPGITGMRRIPPLKSFMMKNRKGNFARNFMRPERKFGKCSDHIG